jgi:hypothetical protein
LYKNIRFSFYHGNHNVSNTSCWKQCFEIIAVLSGVTTKDSDRANPGAPKPKGAPGQNVEQKTFAHESSA